MQRKNLVLKSEHQNHYVCRKWAKLKESSSKQESKLSNVRKNKHQCKGFSSKNNFK